MKTPSPLMGSLVRLAPPSPLEDGHITMTWHQDSQIKRLADSEPVRHFTFKQERELHEKGLSEFYSFMIWTLAEGRLIGNTDLSDINWSSGNAWLGIWIGDKEFLGRGFGTDAMKIIINYAFMEMNLRRISLTVFSYNERAFHLYEKLGFQLEGRERKSIHRAGTRADLVYMGMLRREWEQNKFSY